MKMRIPPLFQWTSCSSNDTPSQSCSHPKKLRVRLRSSGGSAAFRVDLAIGFCREGWRVRLSTAPAAPFPKSRRNASALTDTLADIPAGLQFVSDHDPGIQRLSAKEGFVYQDPSGTRI